MSEGKLKNYEPDEGPIRGIEGATKLSIDHAQSALTRAENWARSLEYNFTDDVLREITGHFFEGVMTIVVRNCLRVYLVRTSEDSDEARAESQRLEHLEDLSEEQIESAVISTAKSLSSARLLDKGPERYRQEAYDLLFRMNRGLMYQTLLNTEAETPNSDMWEEVFQKNLALERDGDEYQKFYKLQVRGLAEFVLEKRFKPVEMSISTLRAYSGVLWLEKKFKALDELSEVTAPPNPIMTGEQGRQL